MEVGRSTICRPAPQRVILLDTKAVIWLHRGHVRVRALQKAAARLYVSPVSLLEIQFLIEAGKVRLRAGATVNDLVADDRWVFDDPPSAAWFSQAAEVSWTDPFDRLIVAHAGLRDWRLATGDAVLAHKLGPQRCVEL